MNSDNKNFKDLPLGFSLALAQDLNALDHFASMTDSKQKMVIEKTKHIKSKEEMRDYINNLKSF